MPAATRSVAPRPRQWPTLPRPTCRPRGARAFRPPEARRGAPAATAPRPAGSAPRFTRSGAASALFGRREEAGRLRGEEGRAAAAIPVGRARAPHARRPGPRPGRPRRGERRPTRLASEARQERRRSRTSPATRARPSRSRTRRDEPASSARANASAPDSSVGPLVPREGLQPVARRRRDAGIGEEEPVRRTRVPEQGAEALLEDGQVVVREDDDVHARPSSGRARGRGSERARSPAGARGRGPRRERRQPPPARRRRICPSVSTTRCGASRRSSSPSWRCARAPAKARRGYSPAPRGAPRRNRGSNFGIVGSARPKEPAGTGSRRRSVHDTGPGSFSEICDLSLCEEGQRPRGAETHDRQAGRPLRISAKKSVEACERVLDAVVDPHGLQDRFQVSTGHGQKKIRRVQGEARDSPS